jgi:hypothetical protein
MIGKKKYDSAPGSSQLDLWGVPQEQKWEDFRKAREYARSLDLQDKKEWEILWRKRAIAKPGIPENPDEIYKDKGWKDWGDWLGNKKDKAGAGKTTGIEGTIGERTLWDVPVESPVLLFDKARQDVWELGFEYKEEWDLYVKGKFPGRDPLPGNIPQDPDVVYKFLGWKGWRDWLVHPDKRIEYTNFYKARDFVRSLRIADREDWRSALKRHSALLTEYHMVLPERPHLEYCDKGWESWDDWLGTQIKYHDFKTTRKFIHSLKLAGKNDWIKYCSGQLPVKSRRTENIYAYPEIAFKDEGWNGWDDWLGIGQGRNEKPASGLPTGAVECRCRGRIEDCPVCDGKGYYFK